MELPAYRSIRAFGQGVSYAVMKHVMGIFMTKDEVIYNGVGSV